jgi:hypothetical protein
MTYKYIKNEQHQAKISELLNKQKAFFAFSQEQLAEGKAKHGLGEEVELVNIYAGLIMPKANIQAYTDEMSELSQNLIDEVKKLDPEEVIRYELDNHEAWYQGDTEDAYDVLKSYGYTREQVRKVYKKYAKNYKDR